VEELRHAGTDRRPGQGCRAAEGHLADRERGAHHPAAAAGLRLYHGQKFYDAVIKTNKNVQWIEYPEEGHGWRLPKNSIDFWGKVETFLDKNIGKNAAAE
jgi:hypothetical protein